MWGLLWPWTVAEGSDRKPVEKVTRLCSDDSCLTRARKICDHAGLPMNAVTLSLLPAMTEVLEAYKQLDEDARK
jgi:hypothetical protein